MTAELGPRGRAALRGLPGWEAFPPAPAPAAEADFLLQRALATASASAPNVSSFLADLRAGRPSEVQFVNGWLAQRGAAQADRAGGAPPAPTHEDVRDAILAMEGLLVRARAGPELEMDIDRIRAASDE